MKLLTTLFAITLSVITLKAQTPSSAWSDNAYGINPMAEDTSDTKPVIISIDNISVNEDSDYAFYLTFDVHYTGADYVVVEIEEEFNTTLRSYRFYEPDVAHVTTGNITKLYYSWVTVKVSNEYGNDSKTLEFVPAGITLPESSSAVVCKVQIFGLDGKCLFNGTPTGLATLALPHGIYLKREIFDNGLSKTSKIHIQ